MSTLENFSAIVNVPSGTNVDIQPPAGEHWCITHLAPAANILALLRESGNNSAQITAALTDGQWLINNDCYLRLYGGVTATVQYSGVKLPPGMTVASTVQSLVQDASYDFRPPSGYQRMTRMLVGESPFFVMSILKSGVTGGIIASIGSNPPTQIRFPLTNDVYLRLTNIEEGTYTVGVSAMQLTNLEVVTDTREVLNGATELFRPAEGEVWVLYGYDAEGCTATIYDGASSVSLSDSGGLSGHEKRVLTRDIYLRMVNGTGSTKYPCIWGVKLP